ncbi:putative E1 protein [Equus caballus papillomavirus 7]|uniref:Replication protein E1 n=1 Tax=Equus caballus papillomavirus 7 TaxID=1235430 RepID=M4HX75_9PAPI|nr:putative E1 protein [Equus caballus papillomavirus 7]AFU07686.1 putative E1 protein [Equus caballus papillomavirus 7]UJP31701.1 E1 protein [Equus caballus papillomavirus 7]
MDPAEPGTSRGAGGWFVLQEAHCSDPDSEPEGADEVDGPDLCELIDNGPVTQGNSLALFQRQITRADQEQLGWLKRKYAVSPEKDCTLSPRLNNIHISPEKLVKRRLFLGAGSEDSGLELSAQNEASLASSAAQTQTQPQVHEGPLHSSTPAVGGRGVEQELDILRLRNRRAVLYGRFKDTFGVSFSEITRQFRSDKTVCRDWVVAIYGVRETLYESLKVQLQPLCDYMHLTLRPTTQHNYLQALLQWKAQKSRETVQKLLKTFLQVHELQMLVDPPQLRSLPAALYWYKTSLGSSCYSVGQMPDWVTRQTTVSHQEEELRFDLSRMVQWAFDNQYDTECLIAYHYASLAEIEPNAAAFLSCTNQAKMVRDCCTMVNLYRRAIMREMSMSAWLHHKMKQVSEAGHWRDICGFLKYQQVSVPDFIGFMKQFLKGRPKRNCLVIAGPPDTGKSLFCMSFLKFLGGKVLSYANAKSHFWMQPAQDAKVVLIDDATKACWDYMDTHLRNAFDGNLISLDAKHKAPQQIKCPPIIITTNEMVHTNDRWRYLHSRIKVLLFGNPCPMDEQGEPAYKLNDGSWKSFFQRLWSHLELSDQEDEGEEEDGGPSLTFRCSARRPDDALRNWQ